MDEVALPGGNAGGAVLANGTVRRRAGSWTPSVHSLLHFLEAAGFEGAPRALGIDGQGREILSFLPGETVGTARPWPDWVHSDEALIDVGRWLRDYHDVVATYEPPRDAQWRMAPAGPLGPGEVIGHNDAAPYNAVWRRDADLSGHARTSTLIGFIDWDFAAPCPALWDLAFVVFSWVPLHARAVGEREGFTAYEDRPRRLHLLLDSYGYAGTIGDLLAAVHARLKDHVRGIEQLAGSGDPLFRRLIDDGVIASLVQAQAELATDATSYERSA